MTGDNRTCDILVIGAGLAGSMLAYKLINAGLRTLIVSAPSIPAASRAAAGLINPVTGQRMVLQENIDALLTAVENFYSEMEERFDITLLHRREMLRLFQSEKEREAWRKRLNNPVYAPYIDNQTSEEPAIHAGLGGFIQYRTGNLDTNLLLDALHAWFRQQGALFEVPFDHDQLSIKEGHIHWQKIEAGKVIFCEGWRGQHNPWFSWLPFQPAKGEILTIATESEVPEKIINRGKWLLPINRKRFKFGATYEREELDEIATDSAKESLLQAMRQLFVKPPTIEITEHVAGVRPGTRDKQPFLGFHHQHPELGIFNGFGSKGSLLIPWYAEAMVSHIVKETPLPTTADIGRFGG